MAPGYLYAGCRKGEYAAAKIGFTTDADPWAYCRTNMGRFMQPLEIIDIVPVGHARVAETVAHHLLKDLKVEREVFNMADTDGT